METSLHRQLKMHMAASADQTEIAVGDFRIDAIGALGELIEIQHASLGAIRSKISKLLSLSPTPIRVVKPIVRNKWIVMHSEPGGEVIRRRLSPKKGARLDIFFDLVHFTEVFPARRLSLEVVVLDIEEHRIPRKKTWHRGKDYHMLDQTVLEIVSTTKLTNAKDLWRQIDSKALPNQFDTAQLALAIQRPRWFAQKVAYCLRKTGTIKHIGKRGNSQLYRSRYKHGILVESPALMPMDRNNRRLVRVA